MSYELVKSETIYKGNRLDLLKDTVTMPDGHNATREIVEYRGAAAMLPIDDDGKVIFVRQYRHSAKVETLEIPAGTLEKDEDPLVCAVRELEEETSYKADKVTFIMKFYPAIGYSREVLYLYLCEGLKKGNFNFDEDEFISLERYTLEEAIDKIFSGEIMDSKTISAILIYKEFRLSIK